MGFDRKIIDNLRICLTCGTNNLVTSSPLFQARLKEQMMLLQYKWKIGWEYVYVRELFDEILLKKQELCKNLKSLSKYHGF